MSKATQPDDIDALLAVGDTYLEDDGFTERVVTSLPRRRTARLRSAVILGFTVTAALLGALLLPIESVFAPLWSFDLATWNASLYIASAVALVVVVWASVSAVVTES